MRSQVFSALAVSVLATAGLLVGAVPAMAVPNAVMAPLKCTNGYFCAWEHDNFEGRLYTKSRAGRGSQVDVADGKISSGSNATGNQWVGVNAHSGGWDDDVYKWAPYTEAGSIGSASDKIDHFDVR